MSAHSSPTPAANSGRPELSRVQFTHMFSEDDTISYPGDCEH